MVPDLPPRNGIGIKYREGIEVAAKGAAERTRMRRICRIGPIYGATCHRGGFRRCEISPAGTRDHWERERERHCAPSIFGLKSGVKGAQKIDAKDKEVNI